MPTSARWCLVMLGGGVAWLEGRKAAPISGCLCLQAVVRVGAWLPGSKWGWGC